ncbi:hypothetical protein N324_07363, partial [Chlamydotis macqueenii]
RAMFAFEWEDPTTGRKPQFRWTSLPQGFAESPNLFGQALEQVLEEFKLPLEIKLLQYVDDLLMSGEKETEVWAATIQLLNFLGRKGLRVSKAKLHFVEKEVKYLGHLISEGRRRITPEHISGIIAMPVPKTKRELRKFLGLVGYCRLWIENFTQHVKFLYEKLQEEKERPEWSEEERQQFEDLKKKLIQAPVLALPSLEKPFYLYV